MPVITVLGWFIRVVWNEGISIEQTLICGQLFRGVFLIDGWQRKAQLTVGGVMPWAGGPGFYHEAG